MSTQKNPNTQKMGINLAISQEMQMILSAHQEVVKICKQYQGSCCDCTCETFDGPICGKVYAPAMTEHLFTR